MSGGVSSYLSSHCAANGTKATTLNIGATRAAISAFVKTAALGDSFVDKVISMRYRVLSVVLGAVAALSGCAPSQHVTSSTDKTPTASTTSATPTATPSPSETRPDAAADSGTLARGDYFGIIPESVNVPDEVKAAFPGNYKSLVRYALAEQFVGTSIEALHRTPTAQLNASHDEIVRSLDPYMTAPMRDAYREAFADYSKNDKFALLYAFSPLSSPDGAFNMADGTTVRIDDGQKWHFGFADAQVLGTTTSVHNGAPAVNVQFKRSVYIPIAGADKDLAETLTITFLLVPGQGNSWQIDGIGWRDSSVAMSPKQQQ